MPGVAAWDGWLSGVAAWGGCLRWLPANSSAELRKGGGRRAHFAGGIFPHVYGTRPVLCSPLSPSPGVFTSYSVVYVAALLAQVFGMGASAFSSLAKWKKDAAKKKAGLF